MVRDFEAVGFVEEPDAAVAVDIYFASQVLALFGFVILQSGPFQDEKPLMLILLDRHESVS